MIKRKILIISIIALILSSIWEFFQIDLYYHLIALSENYHILIASFGDVFIILFMFHIISIFNGSSSWIKKPKKRDYLLLIVQGLVIASIIEIININLGRWAYKSIMPTIFGVGLTPLIQLSIISILSLYLGSKIKN